MHFFVSFPEVDSPKVHSFWPHVDDVQYLEVTEILPVAAFGLPISEFHDRSDKMRNLISGVH